MAAKRRWISAIVTVGFVVVIAGSVRHGQRVRAAAGARPDAAAVSAALAAARRGEPPSGSPTLLLVTTPGCEPCERARHDLRFLVRPEDLGVRAHVSSSADPAAGTGALGVLVTPAYILVDEEDRLVAITRGYRGPAELRAWLREALGIDAR
jgi:hypothetical protein